MMIEESIEILNSEHFSQSKLERLVKKKPLFIFQNLNDFFLKKLITPIAAPFELSRDPSKLKWNMQTGASSV